MGLFVVGTDTGVGKTLVACAILKLLREDGVDAVGFKPIVTGQEHGRWLDAEALWKASGRVEPIEKLCPLRYRAALAPVPAARREGVEPDAAVAARALAGLAARHACVVAEGIGGLLVPLDARTLLLDFIRASGFPVVLVARAGLGTVNHTLLSLRELHRARVPLAALILNVTRAKDAANLAPSRAEIERHVPGRRLEAGGRSTEPSGHRATSLEPRARSHEPGATSLEPRASSHELRATSIEPRASSHELRASSLPSAVLPYLSSQGKLPARAGALVSRAAAALRAQLDVQRLLR